MFDVSSNMSFIRESIQYYSASLSPLSWSTLAFVKTLLTELQTKGTIHTCSSNTELQYLLTHALSLYYEGYDL